MINCDTDIVAEIVHRMHDFLGTETFELWFGENVSLAWETDNNHQPRLVVTSINEYVASWNRKNYKHVLAGFLAEMTDAPVELVFRTAAREVEKTAAPRRAVKDSVRPKNAPPKKAVGVAAVNEMPMLKQLAAGKANAVPRVKANTQPRREAVQEKPADGLANQKRKFRTGAAMTGNRTGKPVPAAPAEKPQHDAASFQAWMEAVAEGRFPAPPAAAEAQSASGPRSVGRKNGREVYSLSDMRGAKGRYGTFDTFIHGETNRTALTTATEVLQSPGTIPILVFYGETGVGKSHLAEAMYMAGSAAGRNAVHVFAADFVSEFVNAIRGKQKQMEDFRKRFRNADLLVIDNIHEFQDKKATAAEFLSLIDALVRMKKQVVLVCDRPLAELAGFGKDLRSRLNGGVWCRIERPCQEVRLGIVNQLCSQRGLNITLDARRKMAQVTYGDARELSGLMCRMDIMSRVRQQPMDLALLEDVLLGAGGTARKAVQMGDILQAVTQFFGLDSGALVSGGRTRAITQPRMLAMWLARKYTKKPLQEIGLAFGCSSHSTVISAQKKVETLLQTDAAIQIQEQTLNIHDILQRLEEQLQTG